MSISSIAPTLQPNEAFIQNQEGVNEGENSSESETIIASSSTNNGILLANSSKASSISLPAIVSSNIDSVRLNQLTFNQQMLSTSNAHGFLRSQSFTFGEKHSTPQHKSAMSSSQNASEQSLITSSTANQASVSQNKSLLECHTCVSRNQVDVSRDLTFTVSFPIVRSQSENCLSVTGQLLHVPVYRSTSLRDLKPLRSQQEVEYKEETTSTTKTKGVRGPLITKSEIEQEKLQSDHESLETQHESSGEKEGREQHEGSSSEEDDSLNCADIDKTSETGKTQKKPITLGKVVRDFVIFSFAESILSQILKLRVSHLDVLRIFIEVMKICIKSRGIEQNSRLEQRLLQLTHMGKVVDSFKAQGHTLLISGIVAGVMAVVSGAAPIIGNIKGESILNKLGMVFSGLKNMESEKFFENTSKITLAISDMSKATGQVQTAFSESHRSYDEHLKESYKVDADERTRNIEDIKDNWKNLEQFIYQSLQMYHDTTRSLYQ
ncbi:MAG: hypothetical protein RR519_03515 [Victivallaceae bacterium]